MNCQHSFSSFFQNKEQTKQKNQFSPLFSFCVLWGLKKKKKNKNKTFFSFVWVLLVMEDPQNAAQERVDDETALPPTRMLEEVKLFLADYYTRAHLERILSHLSVPPTETTLRINTLKITREQAIALLAKNFANQPQLRVFPHPILSDCIFIPCEGPHRLQQNHPEIFVDHRCGEALLRGADIFAVPHTFFLFSVFNFVIFD
jgi:hypothetical protein